MYLRTLKALQDSRPRPRRAVEQSAPFAEQSPDTPVSEPPSPGPSTHLRPQLASFRRTPPHPPKPPLCADAARDSIESY